MGAGPVARSGSGLDTGKLFAAAEADFARYEVVKFLIDECIDLSLNYRQSGHPGGSRSKVHMMLALLLSGAMRWDLLRPWRRFGDRFVLSAGHTVPLVYATLAGLNEAGRAPHCRDGSPPSAFPDHRRRAAPRGWLCACRGRGGGRGGVGGGGTGAGREAVCDRKPGRVPSMAWFRTQKGRGYGKVDAASHGTAWPMNAPQFWAVRQGFMERYGVSYEGFGSPAPADAAALQAQAAANLPRAMSVLRRSDALVPWLSPPL